MHVLDTYKSKMKIESEKKMETSIFGRSRAAYSVVCHQTHPSSFACRKFKDISLGFK